MKVYENEHFPKGLQLARWPWQAGGPWTDIELRKCGIQGCHIGATLGRSRASFRNVRVIDCWITAELCGAILDGVYVEGLKTTDQLFLRGCAYRHVTLRGKIGRIISYKDVQLGEYQNAYQWLVEANRRFYSGVDWALDIREAEFLEAELTDIPAHLVRRDPVTQVVVTREKAAKDFWRKVILSDQYYPSVIWKFLNDNLFESLVLVAPKRDRHFHRRLDDLQKLRDVGVAEPD